MAIKAVALAAVGPDAALNPPISRVLRDAEECDGIAHRYAHTAAIAAAAR
jgi:hypothetical protein